MTKERISEERKEQREQIAIGGEKQEGGDDVA